MERGNENDLITASDVLKDYQICRATLTRWVNRGLIKRHGKGQKSYYLRSELHQDIWTRQETCQYLAITKQKLAKISDKGLLKRIRVGSRVYYQREQVLEFSRKSPSRTLHLGLTEQEYEKMKRRWYKGESVRALAKELGLNYNSLYSCLRRDQAKRVKAIRINDLRNGIQRH